MSYEGRSPDLKRTKVLAMAKMQIEHPMTLREWTDWEIAPDSRDRPFPKILDAVRAKCLDCTGYSPKDVDECQIYKCPLHPYRMRKNPFNVREYTDEQRQAMAEAAKRRFGHDEGSTTEGLGNIP